MHKETQRNIISGSISRLIDRFAQHRHLHSPLLSNNHCSRPSWLYFRYDYPITDQREALLSSPYSASLYAFQAFALASMLSKLSLSLSLCKVSSSSVSPYKPSRLYYLVEGCGLRLTECSALFFLYLSRSFQPSSCALVPRQKTAVNRKRPRVSNEGAH